MGEPWMLFYNILQNNILFYIILFYNIPVYIILYYFITFPKTAIWSSFLKNSSIFNQIYIIYYNYIILYYIILYYNIILIRSFSIDFFSLQLKWNLFSDCVK